MLQKLMLHLWLSPSPFCALPLAFQCPRSPGVADVECHSIFQTGISAAPCGCPERARPAAGRAAYHHVFFPRHSLLLTTFLLLELQLVVKKHTHTHHPHPL
uniref:Putative secreted protein n=1 Tax=Anopheles marajoara TaxID=58244 RepID=A0A2M4C8X8_9DIPT